MRKTVSLLSMLLLINLSLAPLTGLRAAAPAPTAALQQGGVLTNADVLMMLKLGLSAQVIIAKIKVSNTRFDTSPAALEELKKANASDAVILAMMEPPTNGASSNGGAHPNGAHAAAPLVEAKIPDGTPMELELMSNISSKEAQEGDIVNFAVVNDVIVNGVTIIEKGAPARARIAVAKKSGRWGKSGKLGWAMQDVMAVDGSRISLRMEKKLSGDSKGGTVATGVIVTSLVFWPAAPLWGFKKGKDITMPAGKRFEAFVHGDSTAKGKG
ncbi:MAG TPA: hypothetical protein VK421_16090 [Pyrinomonadaceae bacterium]|nr:hypothetical protein [Pyrinomonadaceae bacterium]